MTGFADFKLQLGCLAIILYITTVYVRETTGKDLPCNKFFDYLLIVAPWAVFFDGFSAYTVNHTDTIPSWLNLTVHLLFFVFVNLFIIGVYLYIINLTVGFPRAWIYRIITLFPGVVSMIVILAFIGQIRYVEGDLTAYSVGVSAYACFVSAAVHFLAACVLMIIKHKAIEKRKKVCTFVFASMALAILIAQILLPQILFTSLFPTLMLFGIYDNFEDPARRRLQTFNDRMVTGFATLVENRDNSTGGHIQRTKDYVEIILKEMRKVPAYRAMLSKDYVNHVKNAAPMHDIGKISTPDSILQKPGKLTPEEFEIMKQHSAVGGEIIKKTFADLNDPEYLDIAYEVARHHHEKWNGKGYPDGLKGEEIPLCARIMAIADVFDAVSAKRVYRDALPLETCFQIIEDGAGSDFDPVLAGLFLGAKEKVTDYYEKNK